MSLLMMMRKYIYILIGSSTLLLGMVGVFLPLLPTTPFLLVTAFCYVRSSQKRYQWLISHKRWGPYLHDIIENRSLNKKTRNWAITIQWISITVSIVLISSLYARLFLFILGVIATMVIMRLKAI